MANLNGFHLIDEEKIMLETMCEQMIEDMGSILTWIEEDKKKSSDLYVYERKKDILKSIVIPNKEMDDQQFDLIKYELVKISFLFLKLKNVRHLILCISVKPPILDKSIRQNRL